LCDSLTMEPVATTTATLEVLLSSRQHTARDIAHLRKLRDGLRSTNAIISRALDAYTVSLALLEAPEGNGRDPSPVRFPMRNAVRQVVTFE